MLSAIIKKYTEKITNKNKKTKNKKRAYEWSQISNHHSRLPELTNSALYIGDNRQDWSLARLDGVGIYRFINL